MKRVLVIAYYFPPSGGPGVQRVLKFVKFFRDFGFEPTVLTVDDGAFPTHDDELLAEIPSDVAVHRTTSIDPFSMYARLTGRKKQQAVLIGSVRRDGGLMESAAGWIRANVFLPDARVGWVPFAAREGARLHRRQAFDVVLTSGPPHSVHLIGKRLKKKTGLPWVADFRDLWTGTNYSSEMMATRLAHVLERRMEKGVLDAADVVTTVSPFWRQVLLTKSDRKADDIMVVQNGYGEDDFADQSPDLTPPSSDVFTIAHVGSLYKSRDPKALWRVLSSMQREEKTHPLRVQLMGFVGEEVLRSIDEHNLEKNVAVVPYAAHSEAVKMMRMADLLLLSIEPFENDKGMITGKLYEYIAAGPPILGIGPSDGDAARLLDETNSGRMFSRTDANGIREFLEELLRAYKPESSTAHLARPNLSRYTRKAQTGEMARVLTEAIASA